MTKIRCPKCGTDQVMAEFFGRHIICYECGYEKTHDTDEEMIEYEPMIQESIRRAKNG